MTDGLLNLAAQLLLRTCKPLTAHAALSRVGRCLPPRAAAGDVEAALSALGGRGTCLSRCLAVAARAPAADVVIGVRRDANGVGVSAHAWLELAGIALDPTPGAWSEIARLSARRSMRD